MFVDTKVVQNIPPHTSNPSGVEHVFENLSPKFLRSRKILKEFQQPANFFFTLGFQSIASMAAHMSRQLCMAAYRFPPSSPSQQHQLHSKRPSSSQPPLRIIDGYEVLACVHYLEEILRGSIIFPCWLMLQDGSLSTSSAVMCNKHGYMLDRHMHSIVKLMVASAFLKFLPATELANVSECLCKAHLPIITWHQFPSVLPKHYPVTAVRCVHTVTTS